MSQNSERPNPFYFLLLLASVLFVMTALGYIVVPMLEDHARQSGQVVPPSPFREEIATHGWLWLLYELAAMFVFGILSMVLDRMRSLHKGPEASSQ